MNFIRIFNNQISKTKSKWTIIIVVGLYCVLTFLLRMCSNGIFTSETREFVIDPYSVRGIITQMQLMLSIYVVLALEKEGYITALLLNSLSIFMTIYHMKIVGSMDAMPGVVANIAALLIVTLIMNYKNQTSDYLARINKQKKQLIESDKKLYQQAYTDYLTRLPNRFLFIEKLDQAIEKSQINNTLVGVIFIDLDAFKRINDSLGHAAGDELLVRLSGRLTEILNDNYMVARFGGDEFIILAKNIDHISQIEKKVIEILQVLSKPVMIEGVEFFISGSAGIATYPNDGIDGAELIKNADISMYEAKKKGKNQYMFCNQGMKEELKRKNDLINYLYKALEKQEFFIEYQPQVGVETGAIIGVEALLRWENPEYGLVPPRDFIPLAEQTGLIKSIGLWVFKTVCQDYQKYSGIYKKNMRVSINFSLEQLKDMNIIKDLKEILYETNMDPRNIEIEITESVAFSHELTITDRLIQLKEMGFLIAIDDFGKEYSSLNRIRHFPIDLIKIDMDFIHGISYSDKDRSIVRAIIILAKTLGYKVLAEGVETQEQYDFLRKEQCDEIQGYFFYKPMLSRELIAMMTEMLLGS